LILGVGAGGGTDFYSRMVAAYWAAVVDGGSMVVRNMVGGDYTVACNFVAEAKPDGLTLGMGSNGGSSVHQVLFDMPNVKWNKDTFTYIGSRVTDQYLMAMSVKSDIETIDQLKAKEGGTLSMFSIESGPDRAASVAFKMLGLKDWKIIRGYDNLIDAALGCGKGETDGTCLDPNNLNEGINNGWLKQPIVCVSDRRSPFWPDCPAITELVDIPAELQGAWSIHNDWTGRYNMWTKSDVPEDRLQFLADKFQEINELPGFMRQAKLKWLPEQLDTPLTREEINKVMEGAWGVKQADSDKMEELQLEASP